MNDSSGERAFRAEPGGARYARRDLLDLRYDVAGIGPQGHAPRSTEVPVRAVVGDGEAVTGPSWSADGGATWTESELVDGVAAVDAPEGSSTNSLRATASDTAGETITETVPDACLVQ